MNLYTAPYPDNIERLNVEPVNARRNRQPLYAPRRKVFPKRAEGRFRRIKWIVMREFATGSVTSVFLTLRFDGRTRHFHSYCDLSDKGSPERMRDAIIARETRPVKAMARQERLEHIWSTTHDGYRVYAGEKWPLHKRGKRVILLYGGRQGAFLKLLDDLSDAEIAAKLPVQLRHLPDDVAA